MSFAEHNYAFVSARESNNQAKHLRQLNLSMMRRRTLDVVCSTCRHCAQQKRFLAQSTRRSVQISATPSSTQPVHSIDVHGAAGDASPAADARFEVLGTPSSLLTASISASQSLYTRRGTLVGFNGTPDNAISSLSILSPILRAPLGIPFLYQRITSTTPFNALIGAKNLLTSITIIHLDGRLDWMVAQRNALLAWTGHTLTLSPRTNVRLPLSHWGKTSLTGRGLVALAGKGQIHQIHLRTGDEYIVHPSNVVAYSITQHAPQPYRFKATALRLQIPNVIGWFPDTRFWNEMRKTTAWRVVRSAYFTVRTWARRTIWGDRLFLHFKGPVDILVQARGSTLSEVLTNRDVNEIADTPAGTVTSSSTGPESKALDNSSVPSKQPAPTTMTFAEVKRDGKVEFDQGKTGQS